MMLGKNTKAVVRRLPRRRLCYFAWIYISTLYVYNLSRLYSANDCRSDKIYFFILKKEKYTVTA